MEISKELFEAVMNIKLGTYYSDNIETERRLWIDKDLICWDAVPFVDEISINDFFFKCKEWASTKGYILFSKTRLSSSLASCYFDVMGFHDYEDDFKNDFRAESEQQAVFDACQWILENKGN